MPASGEISSQLRKAHGIVQLGQEQRKQHKSESKKEPLPALSLFLPARGRPRSPQVAVASVGFALPGPRDAREGVAQAGGSWGQRELRGSPGGLLRPRDRGNGSSLATKENLQRHSKGSESWGIKSVAKRPERTERGARFAAGQGLRK